eukprot:jgi/Mesvir1/23212/Mv22673-RA.1
MGGPPKPPEAPERSSRRKRDRIFLLKSRIVMVAVVTSAIIVAAVVTWQVSLDTTNESFNAMSLDLRADVVSHAATQLQQWLTTATVAWQEVQTALTLRGVGDDVPYEEASVAARESMWAVFHLCTDCSAAIFTFARAPVFTVYRQGAPESAVMGPGPIVGHMDNVNDTEMILYQADQTTGLALRSGPSMRLCFFSSCPPGVLDPTVYTAPTENPHRTPLWLVAQGLPAGKFRLATNIGPLGDQPVLIFTGPVWGLASRRIDGTFSIAVSSSRLRHYLDLLPLRVKYNGIVMVTFGPLLRFLAATIEEPIAILEPGKQAAFLSAMNSTNSVVRTGARYVSATWGTLPSQAGGSNATDDVRRSATIHVHGRHYYVTYVPLAYEGLSLGVTFLVPRASFRSGIDDDRRQALGYTMAIAFGMLALACAGIFLSTLNVGKRLTAQAKKLRDIGQVNTHLQAHISSLEKERESTLRLPRVDMGTPLEKLTGLIDSLQSGAKVSDEQLSEMRRLVRARDLHKPKFLQAMEAQALDGWNALASGNAAAQSSHKGARGIDKETTDWLVRTVAGMTMVGAVAGRRISVNSFGNRTSSSSASSPFMGGVLGTPAHALAEGSPLAHPPSTLGMHGTAWQADQRARVKELSQRLPVKALAALSAVCKDDVMLAAAVSEREGSVCPVVVNASAVATVAPGEGASPLSPRDLKLSLAPCPSFDHGALISLLSTLGEWDFDTLALAKVSNEMPILLVGYSVLERAHVLDQFCVPRLQLANFLHEMDRGMRPNPYHNRAHIADVAASLYHVISRTGMEPYIRPIDKFAALVAALVHDFKHPGTNSDFVRNSKGMLSLIYNDRSILENFHLAEAFRLMQDRALDCNFLAELSGHDYDEVRHIVIELVLASDLKQHFSIMESLRNRAAAGKPWDKESAADRLLLLKLAMKVADIGHAAKPLEYHLVWSNCMQEEFFMQGDTERELDLAVSPFMDRHNAHIPKSQVGFFTFIALPLYELFAKLFPNGRHLLEHANANTEHWAQLQKGDE